MTYGIGLAQRGPSLRTQTPGPEIRMVLDYVSRQLPSPGENESLQLFLEPKIESGFPDAVVIYLDEKAQRSWSDERLKLVTSDLKLLHHLHFLADPNNVVTPRAFPNWRRKDLVAALGRLSDANVVAIDSDAWVLKPLTDVYAIKRLIAIEAKISDWCGGLDQAVRNTWFATESYLLLPSLMGGQELRDSANRLGIGLITPNTELPPSSSVHSPEHRPQSYVSWLFNEWAGYRAWERDKDAAGPRSEMVAAAVSLPLVANAAW